MGLGPIPAAAAAAAAPGGVEARTVAARRGGGGRGGFKVWYRKNIEKGKKGNKILIYIFLWKVGEKKNHKSIEQDFNGIHTGQNHQAN